MYIVYGCDVFAGRGAVAYHKAMSAFSSLRQWNTLTRRSWEACVRSRWRHVISLNPAAQAGPDSRTSDESISGSHTIVYTVLYKA